MPGWTGGRDEKLNRGDANEPQMSGLQVGLPEGRLRQSHRVRARDTPCTLQGEVDHLRRESYHAKQQ